MENNDNAEIQFLKESIRELKDKCIKMEERFVKIESSREKTEFQYEQIMKALDKLNDKTLPNLLKEIESIKNKPAKRWETGINALISAIVAGLVGFGVNKLGGK